MRTTDFDLEQRLAEFAEAAARHFRDNPHHNSYGLPDKGEFLALRWGALNRGVLVLKQDADFEPVNFVDAVVKV